MSRSSADVPPSRICVAIPTRGRPELLQRTLDALGATVGAEALDVLVVDDGSEPHLAPRTAHLACAVRVHRQAAAGLNAARTTAVRLTDRPIIAFLDDDVRVEPGWAVGVAGAFADARLDVMAGRVLADPELPVPAWVHPHKLMYLSVLDLGDEPVGIPRWASPVGANLAVSRAALERVGGFRGGLDRTGVSLLSGGDTDLVRRIEATGGRVGYWPAATVHHHIAAERLTRAWFRQRARAQGASDVLGRWDRRPGAAALLGEAVRPARALGIAAKRLAARQSLVDAELWLWSCRGRREALRGLPR